MIFVFSSCSNKNEGITENLESIPHLVPLEFIEDSHLEEVKPFTFNKTLQKDFTINSISKRSDCPTADQANNEYEWAEYECDYSTLYCAYLSMFWYTHVIIAYVDCGISSCPSYLWAINQLEGALDYYESMNLHPVYVTNINEQIDYLKTVVAAAGC